MHWSDKHLFHTLFNFPSHSSSSALLSACWQSTSVCTYPSRVCQQSPHPFFEWVSWFEPMGSAEWPLVWTMNLSIWLSVPSGTVPFVIGVLPPSPQIKWQVILKQFSKTKQKSSTMLASIWPLSTLLPIKIKLPVDWLYYSQIWGKSFETSLLIQAISS